MSDELDDLKRALDGATPAPDARHKAAVLRQAQESFQAHQGSRSTARPITMRGTFRRVMEGVKNMLHSVSTRAALGMTTAALAVAMVMVLPLENIRPVDGNLRQPTALDIATPASTLEGVEVPILVEEEASQSVLDDVAGIVSSLAVEPRNQTTLHEPAILPDLAALPEVGDREVFATADDSPLQITRETPVSTFSVDVDTSSYSILRSTLSRGELPSPDAVRVEEMINYFPYDYPTPESGVAFRPSVSVLPTPWNPGTQLVHIGIQGQRPLTDQRPPLNLVFLVDTSGSMRDPNKLPLLKQSLRLLLAQLRPEDEIAIVSYAGSAGLVLEPTPAGDDARVLAALNRLEAGGGTAGLAGLEQAYAVAEDMTLENEVTRVLLATDGDFNIGIQDPEDLKDYIATKRDSGTYLSVLGFGRGNLDDATMQALAQSGNGTASYIDTLSEARKVLVDQLSGALFPIADDVKIQVEFNPAQIAEWRLIGYETRTLAREDFTNDRVDAGEIGAGHSVTAIYEVTPAGSDAVRNAPLRYSAESNIADIEPSEELGFLKLRYKEPGQSTSRLIEMPILPAQSAVGNDVAFSVAVAGFGQLLRQSPFLENWSWDDAISLAQTSRGTDQFGYRAEAITLMRLAQALDN